MSRAMQEILEAKGVITVDQVRARMGQTGVQAAPARRRQGRVHGVHASILKPTA